MFQAQLAIHQWPLSSNLLILEGYVLFNEFILHNSLKFLQVS